MSPDTMKAIESGAVLTDHQVLELADAEAKQAGLSGVEEAIARLRERVPARNFLESDVRQLLRMVTHAG